MCRSISSIITEIFWPRCRTYTSEQPHGMYAIPTRGRRNDAAKDHRGNGPESPAAPPVPRSVYSKGAPCTGRTIRVAARYLSYHCSAALALACPRPPGCCCYVGSLAGAGVCEVEAGAECEEEDARGQREVRRGGLRRGAHCLLQQPLVHLRREQGRQKKRRRRAESTETGGASLVLVCICARARFCTGCCARSVCRGRLSVARRR